MDGLKGVMFWTISGIRSNNQPKDHLPTQNAGVGCSPATPSTFSMENSSKKLIQQKTEQQMALNKKEIQTVSGERARS